MIGIEYIKIKKQTRSMANLQKNELQLEGRINNQILAVKGLI